MFYLACWVVLTSVKKQGKVTGFFAAQTSRHSAADVFLTSSADKAKK